MTPTSKLEGRIALRLSARLLAAARARLRELGLGTFSEYVRHLIVRDTRGKRK
jgi:hypothetical protein